MKQAVASESYVVEPKLGVLPIRVAMEAQAQLLRQFAVKSKARLSPEKCLAALASDSKDRRLRELCRRMHAEIVRGAPLSIVMREHCVFDAAVLALVEAAERSGNLTDALTRASDYLERAARLRRDMHDAIVKPLNVLSLVLLAIFIAAVVLAFLVKDVVPEVQLSHASGSSALDRVAVEVSRLVRQAWLFVGVAGAVGFLALQLVPRWTKAQSLLEKFALRLPLVSAALSATAQALLCRTTAVVMQAGVLLGDAVTKATSLSPYGFMRSRMTETIAAIEGGQPYIEAFVEVGFFRRAEINNLQAAQRRDDLGTTIVGLADDREREAHVTVGTLKAVAHTLAIVLLAVAAAAVVVALYVPVFVSR
jgi:type II secretory pathway component PulF